jgi:arylsulfatase A-like enzyme
MPRTLLAAFAALVTAAAAPAADRPNVLFVVADDLGWNDVGWHGGPPKTPHLDALVKGGVELDRHYVQPVCTPTRTALMTGRCPSRFGPQALVPSNVRALPPNYPTVATALQAAGYETCMAGKWHLGSREEWGPQVYGFRHSYGSLAGAVDPWKHTYRAGPYEKTWHRDGRRLDETGNATELVAAQVVKWIEAKRAPWFVYVPFHAVHIPIDCPPEFKRLYDGATYDADPKRDESYRRFAAFVSQLDAKVGEFVAALDRTGQRANTLIVFTSDNGGLHQGGNAYVSDVPPTPRLSSNAPLRGQKGTLYEGGIRVPAFVHWSGRLSPGKRTAPLHAVDWYPTLMAATGSKPVGDPRWDGLDRWAVVTGDWPDPGPRTIYVPYNRGAAVRHGDWKLIEAADGKAELFNVEADPSETRNLAAAEPGRVADLRALLKRLRADDVRELPKDLAGIPN